MIRAVAFDAVGTLLHPEPGVAQVYADIGRRHGSRLEPAEVRSRFRAAFARQEAIDRDRAWVTDEERERQRWRDIVAEVLDDAHDPEGCFQALWEHFAKPAAWRCDPDTDAVLSSLRGQGLTLALASNFDARLHGLVSGLPALHPLRRVIISSEVGVRKPAPAFFEALRRQLEWPAEAILVVGDDLVNDHDAARAAGMHAMLLGGTRTLQDVLVQVR